MLIIVPFSSGVDHYVIKYSQNLVGIFCFPITYSIDAFVKIILIGRHIYHRVSNVEIGSSDDSR